MGIKNDILFLGLDVKKEILKIVLINVVSISLLVFIYLFVNQIYFFIFSTLAFVVIDYILFTSYSSKRKKAMSDRLDEVVQIISYFKIYISTNNNIYHSFESVVPYASEWMANELNSFLKDIDRDKTITPFINFAKNFGSKDIENIMISIYQMVDEGESIERLSRFELMFSEIERQNQNEKISNMTNSLDLMNNFPLFGAGFVTVILSIGIINVLGGLVNGL